MAARTKKKSRSGSRLSRNKKTALIFVLIFALIGGYYLYKSFANPLTMTGSGQTVLAERRNTGELASDGDRLTTPETISFRLYDNGLAVCGGYNDKAHSARYYSSQLTQPQVDTFMANIRTAGFFTLQDSYSSDGNGVVTSRYQQLSALDNTDGNKGKVVISEPGVQLPAAYSSTNAVIDALCGGFTQPYQPATVAVTTKIVADTTPASNETVAADVSVDSAGGQAKTTLRGVSAQSASKTVGKTGQVVLKKGSKKVEVRQEDPLPAARDITPNTEPNQVSYLNSGFRIPGTATASAAVPPVKFYKLCASDVCDVPVSLGPGIVASEDIYARSTGRIFDYKEEPVFRSSHDWGYLVSCHGYQRACGTGETSLENVLRNLNYELFKERKWGWDSPRIFELGFNANTYDLCGISYNGGWQIGVTTTLNTRNGWSCSQPAGFDQESVAHELGHTLGMTHVSDGTLMHPSACFAGYVPPNKCVLNGLQAIQVSSSSWLHPKK